MSRRLAVTLRQCTRPSHRAVRAFSSTHHVFADPTSTSTSSATTPSTSGKKPLSSAPIPITSPPVFPAPSNPFEPPPADRPVPQYSETTKTLVRGVAKLLGYNSAATTAIRESGRMMKGIVEGIERDRVFWYDECNLPPTYQTFFQLHLLYVLILLPRLRVVPATANLSSQPIPEPNDPSPPSHSPTSTTSPSEAITSSTSSTSTSSPIFTKPFYESYVTELLSHFFELAESQMRIVLGRGERERVVKKYMEEMGQQWKGAGAGLDYVLGLSSSENLEERLKADSELASWVWRNLFDGKGLIVGPPLEPPAAASELGAVERDETEFVDQLAIIVRFVRKEMARLDKLSDEDVLQGNIGEWGSPK